jgi:mRNA interferase YafQ
MRTIRYTSCFKCDYKREKSGRHGKKLDAALMEIVNLLATDTPPPHRNFDHPLAGEWADHRDCHITPDLILIYRQRQKIESSLFGRSHRVSLLFLLLP